MNDLSIVDDTVRIDRIHSRLENGWTQVRWEGSNRSRNPVCLSIYIPDMGAVRTRRTMPDQLLKPGETGVLLGFVTDPDTQVPRGGKVYSRQPQSDGKGGLSCGGT